ncbi:FdtA/QdtA family cupin domain-containing protein [Clostridium estertheticum]|uniref:WxcM-like domain-containing protein n=1 Tax=Clostridium estertheticum TaxID=238834 RepID=A0A5N7J5C0_9CLOT|nr:FdtA/QdtA family cupin domain-containing protein [Clostridium estertheticum]MBW9151356.1 FdtA/QdtA family cupin domain-containing protein [Clostridium estertheticum]MPQ33281.1 WxcM-like domain-containing protein [Clostridium estertheticum]MPQ63939.1 WxcM-like domain-containing protein [Clostridium estertheticum]WLC84669.1 FdtA/QdtA family cupin domain-containing protein [Clostridium estertheticum]
MYNCALIKFKDITDKYGHLTPIESKIDTPFEIKRIYYITKVEEGVTRGFHSHRKLHQVLICLNGSVKIRVKNPKEEEVFELNDPSVGLYIGPLIWREMFDFTEGSVLLVLASDHYDENDYMRNYDFYLEEAKKLF